MSQRTQYEFLFVGRDEGSFVENYAYDLGEGGENSGKIFVNLEIQNNPAEAEAIGETVFDSVRKAFYADPDKDAYARFEDAIRVVNKSLMAMKSEKVSKYIGNLHVLIAAIVGNTLYLAQTGDAEAYLIRRRLCTTITEGLQEENPNEVFTNIASGTLEPGDFVLFNSTRLLRYISKTDLAKICSSHNLIASLGELKEYLMTEVLGKVGLIGITVQEVAPGLNENEKGQIVAHLQKEESFSTPRKKERSGGVALRDVLTKLTDTIDDLKKRLPNMKSGGGVRTQRASAMRSSEGGGFSFAGMSKERLMVVVIAAVLILTLGIWWLRSRASEQELIDKYTVMLSEVQEEIASAETTGQFNKDQAGEMLNHAEKTAIEVLNSRYMSDKANQYLLQIQESRDGLDGVLRPDARVVADLTQKRPNVSALGLLSLNNVLYAYEYNALYPIVADTVQDPLTIDENETVITATMYDDEDSLLFYTKSGKLIEYKDNRMTFVDTVDGVYKKGVAVQGYSNKFYVLDPENNQIWRYTRRRDKFDTAEQWNVNADVKNGVSMAIDGNIYVLNKDGFITKIFSGNQEDYAIKKAPIKALTAPTKIFTELDLNRVFVLEPSEKRVLVFNKDDKTGGATYANQLVFEDLTDLRDISFDKDTNKLYLLDQSKVYVVAL
ncbi:MAG TPA: hypothetical protein VI588_02960 [Candidatus Gracilibacteria bacterium]|nr:hypothetical protein [Candidatus Gracilibacteria bacterium]